VRIKRRARGRRGFNDITVGYVGEGPKLQADVIRESKKKGEQRKEAGGHTSWTERA